MSCLTRLSATGALIQYDQYMTVEIGMMLLIKLPRWKSTMHSCYVNNEMLFTDK